MWPQETDLPFDGVHLVDRPWFPYLCTEVEHWEWETSGEAHYNFWVALDGDGYLTTMGQTFRLRPGMFFIFSPNQSISAAHYSGPRVTRFSAHFIPISGAVVMDSVSGFPVLAGQVRSLSVLKRQIDAMMRLAFRREQESLLHRQMYQLIEQACAVGETASNILLDDRISKAIHRMRQQPEAIQSMGRLADEVGMSRSHFDREFTRQVGQPPKQFLLNSKMIEARRFLESTGLRVGEVAERLGYRDIYFFSRQFKMFFGVSPKHYRGSLREG
ncbi:MAG: helix-turn-helix domain-containing protein [Coraliomargarita sp.]